MIATARRQLRAAGVGAVVAGSIALAAAALAMIVSLLVFFTSLRHDSDGDVLMTMATTYLIASLPVGVLLILGGVSMCRANSFGLAMVGCIAGLVPHGPTWLITAPLALWGLITLRGRGVRLAFEAAESEPEQSAPVAAKSSQQPIASGVASTNEAIRRRVAGPAIGLMVVGAIGLLPCVALVLSLPALVIFPAHDNYRPGPDVYSVPVPVGAAVLPSFAVASPPVLLAQGDLMHSLDTMARGPLWGVIFIGLTVLLGLPLSLVMIIGGWQMRQLKSYGLATIASVLAMLPCTAAWMIGLPIGLWALVVLMQPEVREAFES